jgi:hypothetical protein
MKYIIIDPEEGVFLGTAKNDELDSISGVPAGVKILALFSTHNIFDITKAVSFNSSNEAEQYLKTYIQRGCPKAFVAKIDAPASNEFVDVIDIIKAGYGEYTREMVDAIPMYNKEIH